jgi:hypothetical protein
MVMKIILSRKGFDSAYGGYPSPILHSGEMVSLPIPSGDAIRYSDLKIGESTYFSMMNDLRPKITCSGEWLNLNEDTRCHLDPDIYKKAIDREINWKPCFGQTGGSQGHLRKQEVREGDLFLYFGWFRKTVCNDGKLVFDPPERDMHAIFGYLQIGEINRIDQGFDVPKWMEYHSHAANDRKNEEANTIYVARDNLSWNELLPGAGRFIFNDKLVLTKKGYSKSKWSLPDCFREAEISYHKNSWKDGYFQSATIGQEFVIKDNEKLEEWAMNLIDSAQIDY